MIPRYSRKEMASIWDEENKFSIWLKIEILAAEAMAEHGIIPKDAVTKIKAGAGFDVERINQIEKETRHDVIAFLTNVAEHAGQSARYLHQGMTSSDVLDTCLSVQLTQAADILLSDIDRIMDILKKRAFEHKETVMIGRSHGIHAEPTTFGLKLALWHDEMKRNRVRLEHARTDIAVGKISGAVGTFAHLPPDIETYVCKKLGLAPAPVSTQIIQRDRHAAFMSCLGLIASTMEKIAVEIRHLQHTEVSEVEEYFHAGQKGSSAMPHKRNPVLSENITGLARIVRSAVIPAMENIPLWHERDISHSSVERMICPDATVTLDFGLNRLAGLLEKLIVYPENMKKNLNKLSGLIHSQQILLLLTQKGASRELAYRYVQKNAMKVWEHGANFKDQLLEDKDILEYLTVDDIKSQFDLAYHLKHVDTIFKRVFGGV